MSQFDSMSPLMGEALRAMADGFGKDAKTEQKRELVASVIGQVSSFNETIVAGWLMSLDEQSINEVGELFKSADGVTPEEFMTIMKSSGASCPFKVIGDMITGTKE